MCIHYEPMSVKEGGMKRSNVIIVSIAVFFLVIGSEFRGIESRPRKEIPNGQTFSSQDNSPYLELERKGGFPEAKEESLSFPEEISQLGFGNPPRILSDTTFLTLPPGGCSTVAVVCSIPAFPPVADILIDFDLTGSMGQELDSLKDNAINIMNGIRAEISNSTFGLISAEDYNANYFDVFGSNCGYSGPYGSGLKPDSPYRLDIALTSDIPAVENAINAMFLGDGADGAEDYTRQLYESIAELETDTNGIYGSIGWRPDAKKIVLAFNDNLPHDCNITQCIGGFPFSFGRDPGRDEIENTGDDLVLLNVLDQMAFNNVSLVDVYSGDSLTKQLWDCWTALTPGGGSFLVNPDGSIPGGVSIDSFIVDLIHSTFDTLDEVTARVCGGDSSFLNSVTPPSYNDVPTPSQISFDLEFCVPPGTPPGTYCIDVCTYTDNLLLCSYTVCINVTSGVGAEEEARPNEFLENRIQLLETSPNPFQSTTLVRYSLPESRGDVPVRLDILDISGRKVKTLVDETQGSGVYTVEWDSRTGVSPVSSGIYFYRLEAGEVVETMKFILLR